MGGKKRVVPAHRGDGHARRTRKSIFPSRAKTSTARGAFQRRTNVMSRRHRHWNRTVHPTIMKRTPSRPLAVASRSQPKSNPPSTLGGHSHNLRNPPPKPTRQPSVRKAIPPTPTDPPPNRMDIPHRSKSRRPKSKCLPPKPKGPLRESKRLPPNPKDLPPTPSVPAPPAASFYPNAQGFTIGQQNIHSTQTFNASKALFDCKALIYASPSHKFLVLKAIN